MPLILILIAIAIVAYQGNIVTLGRLVGEDIPNYAPWIGSLLALWLLSQSDTLKPVVQPFLMLAIITTIVLRYTEIETELRASYASLTKTTR